MPMVVAVMPLIAAFATAKFCWMAAKLSLKPWLSLSWLATGNCALMVFGSMAMVADHPKISEYLADSISEPYAA
jgi:hypothetical protein